MMNLFRGNIFILFTCYAIVVLGVVGSYYFRKQFLVSLLSLEFVVLGLFLGRIITLRVLDRCPSLALYVLVLGACEARLGLRLLVSMTRIRGGDMLRLIRTLKC